MPALTTIRKIFLFFEDITLLYLSLFLALFVDSGGNLTYKLLSKHLFPFTILFLLWLLVFYVLGFYDLSLFNPSLLFYSRLITSLVICGSIGVFFFYLFPSFGITPKTNLVLTLIIFGALTLLGRNFFSFIFF